MKEHQNNPKPQEFFRAQVLKFLDPPLGPPQILGSSMRFTHIYAKYQIFSKAAIKHLSNLFVGDPFQKHPSYAPNESLYKLIDFIYVKS